MALFPEQLRALEYARKRGTNAPVDAIRSRVAGTYAEFEALVAALPPAVVREQRSTSTWSVQEVVDHLIESDRPAIDQLAQLLAGRDVDAAIPASLQSHDPLGLDWPGLLREFNAVHQRIVGLLAAATDDLPLTATAPIQMVVKCAGAPGSEATLVPVTWIERLDWKAYSILLHAHNREHIAQVQRILNAPPAAA